MLIAGFDNEGTHIVQICPSANFYPCKAMAIGEKWIVEDVPTVVLDAEKASEAHLGVPPTIDQNAAA